MPGTPPLFADGPRKAGAAPASYTAPAASYTAPAATYAPPVASYAPPVVAAPAPAPYVPRTAPPMPPPPSSETLDEDLGDLAEADVLDDEAHLDTEGPDFAVPFNAAAARAAGPAPLAEPLSDDERESTLIGGTDPGIVVPPDGAAWPEPASFSDAPGEKRLSATVVDEDDEFPED